jgi:uncharacterized membrane protein YcaP (DUF421 family)
MMGSAFQLDWPVLGGIALRTGLVYAALLLGVRLAGKRQIAQLTPFDLVVLLLLSNAVQNAMTGPDTSVTGGVVAAATLIGLNVAVSRLRWVFPGFKRYVEGVPVALVVHGQVQFQALRHEQLTQDELLAALREHEAASVENVELAMLEVDGSVSVIRRDPGHPERVHSSSKKLVRHHRKPN